MYRRYSDFIPFYQQVHRILPIFAGVLPPKEALRPIAGLIGVKTAEPSMEFLEGRRRGLDTFLKELLRYAGGSKTALWNHPTVLNFLDIPVVSGQRDSMAMTNFNGRIPASRWDVELENARKIIRDVKETKERATSAVSRGHDRSNYLRHLRRQLNAAGKIMDKLQVSLDFYAHVDRLPDERLEIMSGAFQHLAGKLELLHESCDPLRDPAPSNASSPGSGGGMSSATPIARTPVRSYLVLPASQTTTTATINGAGPVVASSLERKYHQQRELISSQDTQLSELSSRIQRQREISDITGREIGTTNSASSRVSHIIYIYIYML